LNTEVQWASYVSQLESSSSSSSVEDENLLVPKYKDNSRLRWTLKRFECDYITVTTSADGHVRSVHFIGDEYEHVMRLLEFLDHVCWTGRMILVLIAKVIMEYDIVASILEGFVCCDVNNMFDIYLEKDIEDIKEEVYNANGNRYVSGRFFIEEDDE
jgi:hypothetical protein